MARVPVLENKYFRITVICCCSLNLVLRPVAKKMGNMFSMVDYDYNDLFNKIGVHAFERKNIFAILKFLVPKVSGIYSS